MDSQYPANFLGVICAVLLLVALALQTAALLMPPALMQWGLMISLILASGLLVTLVGDHLMARLGNLRRWLTDARAPERPALGRPSGASAIKGGSVASLHGVTRRFGTTTALQGVDLTLNAGELLAVLGPNGAGKSSAIAILLGLIEPDSGEARLLDGSPLEIRRRRGIGVMMQDVALSHGMRVRELIAQAASYYPRSLSLQQTLELSGTGALANSVYDKLSGGQKRQVQFALAVCGCPAVLFLDEPTVGLDVAARERLWATVRQLRVAGTSILLTTHYLEEAEALADRVVVLASGRVVASGTVESMRAIVARRQIRCESQLAAEDLAQWPGVVSVERVEQTLTILAVDAESVLRRLLQADQRIANLEVHRPGLAEAFVELTREAA